jgi:hypothetical protein
MNRTTFLTNSFPRFIFRSWIASALFLTASLCAATLQVGPSRAYTTPSAAAAVARDGDIVEIDAGVYRGDYSSWHQNSLTLRGVGGRAHIQMDPLDPIPNGKALWVLGGAGVTVENIEFSGSQVPDENGAGIRGETSGALTIRNCYFHDNQNGILGPNAGEVTIEYSLFEHNGIGEFGRTHNIYINHANRLVFRHNLTRNADQEGHTLKSRALVNYVLYNRIMEVEDNPGVTQPVEPTSRAIDLPDAGHAYIVGNLIQQGPVTGNPQIVGYGSESGVNPGRTFVFLFNTVVDQSEDPDHPGEFLAVSRATTSIALNNLFVGPHAPPSWVDRSASNVWTVSATGSLADAAHYDFHLLSGALAIDHAVDAGAAFSLMDPAVHGGTRPLFHYADTAQRVDRPMVGLLDMGAYEFGGEASSAPARPRRLRVE